MTTVISVSPAPNEGPPPIRRRVPGHKSSFLSGLLENFLALLADNYCRRAPRGKKNILHQKPDDSLLRQDEAARAHWKFSSLSLPERNFGESEAPMIATKNANAELKEYIPWS